MRVYSYNHQHQDDSVEHLCRGSSDDTWRSKLQLVSSSQSVQLQRFRFWAVFHVAAPPGVAVGLRRARQLQALHSKIESRFYRCDVACHSRWHPHLPTLGQYRTVDLTHRTASHNRDCRWTLPATHAQRHQTAALHSSAVTPPSPHPYILVFLSTSLYVSKRGAYWDRLCRDVVGRWLSRACTVAKRCILGL